MSWSSGGDVVVGIDATDGCRCALDWAADLAARSGSRLRLVHAGGGGERQAWMADPATDWRRVLGGVLRTGMGVLCAARARVEERSPGLDVIEVVRSLDPRQVLLDEAEDAFVVVLGPHGRHRRDADLLRSVTATVSGHAPCPVVAVPHRAGAAATGSGVVVAVTPDPTGRAALRFAFDQAAEHREQVLACAPRWEDPVEALLDPVLAEHPEVPVVRRTTCGEQSGCLVGASAAARLVVVPAGDRDDAASRCVVEDAACPVAVVPDALLVC